MCFTIYLGSSVQGPLVEWNSDQPTFHTKHLDKNEEGILDRVSLPHVLYMGSDQGCGCGFRHALRDRTDWLPAIEEEGDSRKTQENHVNLVQYLSDNLLNQNIEIYACWNGDVVDRVDVVEKIELEDILNAAFYFKEGYLYKMHIRMESVENYRISFEELAIRGKKGP